VGVSRPRNSQQHRFYWALCRLVALNHEELKDAEAVHQAIKLLSGHFDLVQVGKHMVRIPRSTSFDKMSQEEFDKFLAKAKDVVVQDLLPGVGLRELNDEILRMAT